MNQPIQFLPTQGSSDCPKAVAPVVHQEALEIAVGSGSSAADLLPAVTAGDPAASCCQVSNKGCNDVLLTVSYLDGDDCDPCTEPDALSAVDVEITVPKNSVFPLPPGFIVGITATALDSTGTAVDVQKAVDIQLYCGYQPCCNGAVLAP